MPRPSPPPRRVRSSRASLAIAESTADVRGALGRSLLTVVVSMVFAAIAVGVAAAETGRIESEWDRQVASGRFVFRVEVPGGAAIDAAECERLGDDDGILAAGSVLSSVQVEVPQAPASPFTVRTATPGFARVMWPETTSPVTGMVALVEAADRLGLAGGAYVPLAVPGGDPGAATVMRVAEVKPLSLRDRDSGLSFLQLVPPAGRTRVCLVDAEPAKARAVQSALSSRFGTVDGVSITPLWRGDSLSRSPEREIRSRLGVLVSWLAALSVVGLGMADYASRRQELALYRLVGASPAQVDAMVATRVVLLLWLPITAGVAYGAVATAALSTELRALTVLAVYLRLTAACGFVLAASGVLARRMRTSTVLRGE